ncbi:hypothetical protein DPMN_193211 [Dreissena polymorpha]|uniref:Uncharacterized protein n=1 Tax=Dreissena polymorpha TaxID=45954 RepID=A0A9D4B881_DREPO|nr:hypothetical protein DPMN_193211 [Dreissena polymorpha]
MWPLEKNAPPLDSHVFQANDKLLTKFHKDRKINVASRVLTRKNAPPAGGHFHEDWIINVASREKCPAPWQPCFQAKVTIFELIQDIIGTNPLSKFHEDRKINFHDDLATIVTSRVFTRSLYSHIINTSPPTGGHIF